MLIGHEAQKGAFEDAMAAGRIHHAWLLAGPKGVGKRRFAQWATHRLLSEGVDPERTAGLLAADAHPDSRILTPPEEGKGSATASIIVDQVRELADFLHSHPALGQWKVLTIDSVDNMNLNAANAFLKELEEPRGNTLFLMVSHAPGRLLPTIRSRCRILRFYPLPEDACAEVLHAALPEAGEAEIASLARLSEGAPGSVLELAGADIVGLEAVITAWKAGESPVAAARTFQGQAAAPRLEALMRMVGRNILAAARERQDAGIFALHDEAQILARDAVRLAYDRVQVAMALADILARLGQFERLGRV